MKTSALILALIVAFNANATTPEQDKAFTDRLPLHQGR
jgi:hypothetical protein